MRVIRMAVLIAMVAGPAAFQPVLSQGLAPTSSGDGTATPGFRLNETKEYTDDEKARMKANEDAAKAARAALPNAKVSNDPWAGARAAETPPAKPKVVKPKPQ